ncbi:MAG: ABC transporter permease, partial [Aeromicrobium sp.]
MSSVVTRGRSWVGEHAILLFALLVLLYMFTPIFVVVLMSFNDPAGRLGYEFDGFTLDNWTNICDPYQLCSSVSNSIRIALLSTALATLLGTLM